MLNFFALLLIIFIVLILYIFKKSIFKKIININKFHSKKLIKNKNQSNKYTVEKRSFSYKHKDNTYSAFHKKSQRSKMFKLFRSNTKDKLKALQIAEELADNSTLSILRKGLKDTSPEVVEISAKLIRNFK